MAPQKGLEPLTYRVEAGCSVQLSYWGILPSRGFRYEFYTASPVSNLVRTICSFPPIPFQALFFLTKLLPKSFDRLCVDFFCIFA